MATGVAIQNSNSPGGRGVFALQKGPDMMAECKNEFGIRIHKGGKIVRRLKHPAATLETTRLQSFEHAESSLYRPSRI